jgi:hypothetical protein
MTAATVIAAHAGIHWRKPTITAATVIPAHAGIHWRKPTMTAATVIPAHAGIHWPEIALRPAMDPGFRRDDRSQGRRARP